MQQNLYKEGYVHVIFPLSKDVDGYPPVDNERMWAKKIDENVFRVENTPFYVRGISFGDLVEAKEISESVYGYIKLYKHSGYSTFRIHVGGDNIDKSKYVDSLLEKLKSFGCSTEGQDDNNLIAVNIPQEAPLQKVAEYLNSEYKLGLLDYEEACIADDNYQSPEK